MHRRLKCEVIFVRALITGRQKYYDIFSHVYDKFIQMHSRRDEKDTRDVLVEMAGLGETPNPYILDICCGTGSVILAFLITIRQVLPWDTIFFPQDVV